jgi:hypothetical protein
MKLYSPSAYLLLALSIGKASAVSHREVPEIATMTDADPEFMLQNHMLKDKAPLPMQYISSASTVLVNGNEYSLSGLSEYVVRTPDFVSIVDGAVAPIPPQSLMWRGTNRNGASIMMMKSPAGGVEFINIQDGTSKTTLVAMHSDNYEDGVMVALSPEDYDYDLINSLFSYGDDEGTYVDTPADMFDEDGALVDNRGGHRRTRGLRSKSGALAPESKIAPQATKRNLQSGCSSLTSVDVAIVYDSTFCTRYGGQAGAQARIEAIVGMASSDYEVNGLCTTLQISYLEGWCNPATDIYLNVISNPNLLDIFRTHWIKDRQSTRRDVAHFFSGTDFSTNKVIGQAYRNAVCNKSIGYGINWMTFDSDLNLQSNLFAHELGHNAGAPHYSSGNTGHIMNPSLGDGRNGFSSTTINNINGYLGSQTCLSNVPRAPTPTTPTPPAPTPPAPTPTAPTPPAPTPTAPTSGFCNWGPDGTGATSVCQGGAQGGDWCNTNRNQCEVGCGGKWCTSAFTPTAPAPSPPTGGGTCGGGNVGNGICADTTLCCSQWGWCGNSADYCD